MTLEDEIKEILNKKFLPTEMILINESAKHAGHAGDNGTGQTHFHLTIKSEMFKGLSRIEAHKQVYTALETLFHRGLHALSITIKVPE